MKRLIAILALAWLFFAQPVLAGTVFLVRHAEKAKKPADDPGLTWEGKTRARALAELLESVTLDALFSSDYTRTKSTLAPLAEAKGLEITIYDAGDSEALVRRILEQHYEGTVVIAGHSNTVPALIQALGGQAQPLSDQDYDNLFVVTLHPNGSVSTLNLHYGNKDKE